MKNKTVEINLVKQRNNTPHVINNTIKIFAL